MHNYYHKSTLHVSDSSSVLHQESSTLHTAVGIYHKGYADCLLAIPIAVCTALNSWRWTEKPVRNM